MGRAAHGANDCIHTSGRFVRAYSIHATKVAPNQSWSSASPGMACWRAAYRASGQEIATLFTIVQGVGMVAE